MDRDGRAGIVLERHDMHTVCQRPLFDIERSDTDLRRRDITDHDPSRQNRKYFLHKLLMLNEYKITLEWEFRRAGYRLLRCSSIRRRVPKYRTGTVPC